MSIIFYTNPMSRGQIARWALHEAGAEYEQRIVGYGEEMKGDYARDVNPMGKVPALQHIGQVVTECAAICHYLAETHPEAGLLPNDQEKADYFRWLFYAAGPLEQAISNKALGFEIPDDPSKRGTVGYGHYDLVVDVLEKKFANSDYVCGDRFTMADVYVGSHVTWGMQFGSLPERDSFHAYASRLTGREAYKAAKAIDTKLIEEAQAQG
ncbi:glutathione S-transferase family protein [Sphingomicrobium clamense]|uniref:Glutathione S-transferase family protein n=1 Tax=Sphingomicrobium clamense TaxID=2851013 RepID=A0ABS6V7E7_9SPHN|nr:glutathione S-transferase family protein [Sphingomicrobium sp. B8]MBW0145491.1 glutathione S-transferase family protein [Sphingomicrobium sp. B8]